MNTSNRNVLAATAIIVLLLLSGTAAASGWQLVGAGPSIVHQIAMAPTDPNVAIAVSGDYFLITRDGGAHWSYVSNGSGCYISQMAIAGAAKPRIFLQGCDGVFYSDDYGESWATMKLPLEGVGYLFVHNPANTDQIALLSQTTLQVTTDLGRSWRLINLPASDARVAIDWKEATIHAWRSSNVYKAPLNVAGAWVNASTGLPASEVNQLAINGATVYAATSAGLYKWVSGSDRWSATGLSGISVYGATAGGVSPNRAYAWTSGRPARIFRSDDGSASWTELSAAGSQVIDELVTSPVNGSTVYFWSNDGLVRSTNAGGSFAAVLPSSGLPAGSDAMTVDRQRPGALYAGNWQSLDGGASWSKITVGDATNAAWGSGPIQWASARTLFASASPSSVSSVLLRSSNDGATWQTTFQFGGASGSIGSIIAGANESSLLLFGNDCSRGGECSGFLANSVDGGLNWNRQGSLPARVTTVLRPSSGGPFYAILGGNVYRSTNGTDWSAAGGGLPAYPVIQLAASQNTNPTTLYAVVRGPASSTVHKSLDGGSSWSPASTGLPDLHIMTIVVDPTSSSAIYVGMDRGGVYRSVDGAQSWSSLSSGLYDLRVSDLKFDNATTGQLYASTGAGIFKLDVTKDLAQYATAVEYFHAGFGHYFVTAFPEEVAALDGGLPAGWTRTGETFKVETTSANASNTVCRFFTVAFAPKSSHFYTPYTEECKIVRDNRSWQFEALAYQLRLRSILGQCSVGYRPLYRMFNNMQGGAPNHRYAIKHSIVDDMEAKGWVMEGDGVTDIFACVPN